MTHPYLSGQGVPRVLAHRGFVPQQLADVGVVDNTRAAFAAAASVGARYIETDCRMSRDGEVVLVHDADLTRISGDRRRIAQLSVRELRAVFADRGGLLTLAEAFDAFPELRFNVDVKSGDAAVAAGQIVAMHADRALLTSFSDAMRIRALRAARTMPQGGIPATAPGQGRVIRLLLATLGRSVAAQRAAFAGLAALQIPERQGPVQVLSRRLLDAAHAHGVEVHVWTVNDPMRARRLVSEGVDGIVTDRPDLMGALG